MSSKRNFLLISPESQSEVFQGRYRSRRASEPGCRNNLQFQERCTRDLSHIMPGAKLIEIVQYCTIPINLTTTHHWPSKIDEMSLLQIDLHPRRVISGWNHEVCWACHTSQYMPKWSKLYSMLRCCLPDDIFSPWIWSWVVMGLAGAKGSSGYDEGDRGEDGWPAYGWGWDWGPV